MDNASLRATLLFASHGLLSGLLTHLAYRQDSGAFMFMLIVPAFGVNFAYQALKLSGAAAAPTKLEMLQRQSKIEKQVSLSYRLLGALLVGAIYLGWTGMTANSLR